MCERTCVCNIALCMPEGPDDGVDDQLQLPWGHGEESAKAGVGDGPQQVEELQPMLRIVLQQKDIPHQYCAANTKHLPQCTSSTLLQCLLHMIVGMNATCLGEAAAKCKPVQKYQPCESLRISSPQ